MPWFKVDDSFHSHPKVLAAGNEAVGLYVRCGSYAAQHLTDGFIPEQTVQSFGGLNSSRGADGTLADALVKTKLWRRTRGGWIMPDYLDFNPSKEAVENERRAKAERQKRWREGQRRRVTNPSSDASQDALVTPAPTRPLYTSVRTKPQVVGRAPPENDRQKKINYEELASRLHPLIGTVDADYAQRIAATVLANTNGDIANPINYITAAVAHAPLRYRPTTQPPSIRDLCRHGLIADRCEEC